MEAFECLGMEIYTECEGYDTTIIFFNFPDMNEYYDLCRKYAKRKQVNFRKCDRVLAAEHYVDAEMRWIHSYSYNWGLFVPKKLVKKRSYRLCVELAVDFDSYSELLESLCNIHRYYSDMTAELRRELNAPVSLTVLPPRQQEERSAA